MKRNPERKSQEGTTITKEEELQKNGEPVYPSLWNVVFYNDDVTPFGFVVKLLVDVLRYEESAAEETTMKIQESGSLAVGSYLHSIASAKRDSCDAQAKEAGYPLKVEIERADGTEK